MNKGLSSEEAGRRLNETGYNELQSVKSKNLLQIAFEVIKEPMFILLISCGTLYIVLGDYSEGVVLLCWVFVIIFITFYQYSKTERALEALKRLSSPRALVIRDGVEKLISGRELVREDLVVLNEGNRVPADGVVIDTIHLQIDESLLTGESFPVSKSTESNENKVYSGTLVIQGRGIMMVTETGQDTAFGKIGTSLQEIKVDQTNMQKEMKILIRSLFVIGALMSTVVIVGYYVTRGNFIQSVLNGLASAMAILPEEFPVVLTVFLAIGSWRLSKQHILTRKPSAIETLGSTTVLCSDKTGTITLNKMTVSALYAKDKLSVKHELLDRKQDFEELLSAGFLASQAETIDPMEMAIRTCRSDIFKGLHAAPPLVKEYTLSRDLFAMSRVYHDPANKHVVYCKGAPEAVLGLCRINEQERDALLVPVQQMAEQGQRVLGVAKAIWDQSVLPENQRDFHYEFLGFIGFEDPIRPEVPEAINECYTAGIKVIMITGDFPTTAQSVAIQAGIRPEGLTLTGAELEQMSDEELRQKISLITVFARIVPEQKLRIIQALKAQGEVVAMTGDGVNDAPALKAADIGIAMGGKGTEVAREASSLVLLDDNFSSIVAAIRSGRKIFDNLQKAMAYIIAIHIPIIGLTLLPAFIPGLPIILMPLHIVFMELIIDPVCSIAFESEKEERGIMNRPPRDPKERFFGINKILKSSVLGLFLLGIVIIIYLLAISEGHSANEIRAISFSSLILGNVFIILSTLSKTRSFLSVIREKNIALLLILFVALTLLILIIYVPYLSDLFRFENPGIEHFVVSTSGALVILATLEGIKFYRIRRKKSYGYKK